MKINKKWMALLLSIVMVFGFATAVSAATVNVTVPEGLTGHTFTAYQVFTGTQAESEGALGDVAWGNGINADAFLAALKADATLGTDFNTCTTALGVS